MDYDQIAREFLVLLRGRRSQVAWSRRLGYRSNVAYSWESGRRWPTAAETFRAAARSGIDTQQAIIKFYGNPPPWLDTLDLATPQAVAQILNDLRGKTSVSDLARRAELSRYSVSRWCSGHTQPRLPDFLRIMQAASLRTIDFLAAFVDPEAIPAIADVWGRLEARRRGAAAYPWTQAILRAIELDDYLATPAHEEGWIADRLGIDIEVERRCMDFMEHTGQIAWTGTHWRQEVLAVDTRRHATVNRELKRHWTRVAADRIADAAPGQFSYNVFTVSRKDFERIRELHLSYFHALRTIVGESDDCEVVAVANVQLFALDDSAPEPNTDE